MTPFSEIALENEPPPTLTQPVESETGGTSPRIGTDTAPSAYHLTLRWTFTSFAKTANEFAMFLKQIAIPTLQCESSRLLSALVTLLITMAGVSCAQGQRGDASDVVITEFLAANRSGLIDALGNRSDWIELFNPTDTSVNLAGYRLTDQRVLPQKWIFPNVSIAPQAYLIVFGVGQLADTISSDDQGRLYANFRLSSEGEYLAFLDPNGNVIQEWDPGYPSQLTDISYGQSPSGKEAFFPRPTPGSPNGTRSFDGLVAPLQLSHERGFYDEAFQLRMHVPTDGATIRYSLDGSDPELSSASIYREPIRVDKTSILRVVATKPNYLPAAPQTHSFLILSEIATQAEQPEGVPDDWGTDNEVPGRRVVADYEMDPRVVNSTLPGYGIREALLDLPSLSLSMSPEDLFGSTRGIYTHPLSRGNAWEKVCSIEWIDPNGDLNFQENCQIEIHGNSSRRPWRMQKHSFRLTFKQSLGSGRLEAPLFADSPVESFNKLVLRASFTDSWGLVSWAPNRYRPNDSQYVRDVWMKASLRDMGHPSSHGRWVHLYLNGLYWGIYNVTERLDDEFFSDHLGGEPEDWEVIADFGGSSPGWSRLFSLLRSASANTASEQEVATLLDMDNFIDYMLLHFYADSEDWPHHNGYAARNAGADEPFRFFVWDQEIVLDNLKMQRYNSADSGRPGELFQLLRRQDFFRTRFADRVYFHLHGEGGLNLAASQQRYQEVADEIDLAIVAESARWGDTQQSTPYGNRIQQPSNPNNTEDLRYPAAPNGPDYYFTREDSWVPERDNVIQNYLPSIYDTSNRNSLIRELRSAGLYPDSDPPIIRPAGGAAPSFHIELQGEAGDTIYYTLDGSDPRSKVQLESNRTPLIDDTTRVFYRIPESTSPVLEWIQSDFDHSAWDSGLFGVGYETTPADYATLIRTEVSAMRNQTPTVFLRVPFHVNSGVVKNGTRLILKIRYDDGFVAYLNGVRVAAANAPLFLRWNSQATESHADLDAVNPVEFDLTQHLSELRDGLNVLAFQGLNTALSSSDLLLLPELSLENPSGPLPANQVNGIPYTQPFNLTQSSTLKTRTLRNGEWSALASAQYFIGETATSNNLVISEIHYHPAEDEDAEYLVLFNRNPNHAIDLSGLTFVDGIRFQFPAGTNLEKSESRLLVRSEVAYRDAFGAARPIIGQYEGALSNNGERLRLENAKGEVLIDFEYDDTEPWPTAPDGGGSSLVPVQSESPTNPNLPTSWHSLEPSLTAIRPSNPNADQDNDGLSALLEYALGTSDRDPSSGREAIQSSIETVEAESGLGNYFFLRFQSNPEALGVVITPESSSRLESLFWRRDQLIDLSDSDDRPDWQAYRSRFPIQPDSQFFVRLRVVTQ